MAKKRKPSVPTPEARGQTYYYAGGQRVELTPADDLLAVDQSRLSEEAVSSAVQAELEKVARPLLSGILLIRLEDLGSNAAEVLEQLKQARALQPVFRAHGAVLVVLPEVRVEESREDKQQHLEKWLASHSGSAVIESRKDGQVVLKPASGHGGDALRLANTLTEQLGPEMAQPRFLRVTPRPSTMKG